MALLGVVRYTSADPSMGAPGTGASRIAIIAGSKWNSQEELSAIRDGLRASHAPGVGTPEANCYHPRMITEEAVLKKLRKACLRLPEATETVTFGHPAFQVRKKTFAVLEEYKGELGICVKVGTLLQDVFLKDARFFRTPYIGKYGWVTLRVHAARLNWKEIAALVKGSYDEVADPPGFRKARGAARQGKSMRNRGRKSPAPGRR